MTGESKGLSLSLILINAMVGMGIFALPAQVAASGPVWTFVALLCVSFGIISFTSLLHRTFCSERCDSLAALLMVWRMHFGKAALRLVAGCYWSSAWMGNVAYLALISNILLGSRFWERNFFLSSSLLWATVAILYVGNKFANRMASVLTGFKLVILLLTLGAFIKLFSPWCFYTQIKNGFQAGLNIESYHALLAFSWVFIGFEGIFLLGKARQEEPARLLKLSLGSLGVVSLLYALITLLPFGMEQSFLLGADEVSALAKIVRSLVPLVAAELVTKITIAIFAIGSLFSWMLYASEFSSQAAEKNLFPKIFMQKTGTSVPKTALVITAFAMQALLMLGYMGWSYGLFAGVATALMLPFFCVISLQSWCCFSALSLFYRLATCVATLFLGLLFSALGCWFWTFASVSSG